MIVQRHKPNTTFGGIVVSVLSFLLLASRLAYQWTAFAFAANKQNVCCSESCH